jgi:3-deoxy-D-manno-octulosonic acid kinase
VSRQLRAAGVPTPEVLGYAVYEAGPLLRRADVVTREIPGGRTLVALLRKGVDAATRHGLFEATSTLALALATAGAFHADLNLANVLIAPAPDGSLEAFALDVDRVIFRARARSHLLRSNFRRLSRSAATLGLEWKP